MPKITDIKPQKRRKRVNIFLNDEFSFGLDLETLAKTGLKAGQEISEKKVEEIIKEGEFSKVYNRALKFLSFRPRSQKELIYWFVKKDIGKETQKAVFKKLKKQGFIDDRKFAKWWIEQRITFRPQGLRLMRLELQQKGVPSELIDDLFEEAKLGLSEERLAQKAAEKKLRSLEGLPEEKLRKKLTDFLARRGFSWEVTRKVIESLFKSPVL